MIKNKSNKVLILFGICFSICLISCNYKKKTIGVQNESIATLDNQKWIDPLIKAYRSFSKNPNIKSADLLYKASELMPKKNWEIYFITATIYASNGKKDKAFKSLKKAIQFGLKESDLIANYPKLSGLKDDSRWNEILISATLSKKKYLKNIENPELLKELESMWAQDQHALSQYEENIKSLNSNATYEDHQRLFKPVEDRWEINRIKLDSIINIHGWPGNKLVGEDGTKIAWAIPQHYPDVFFKEECLSLIKEAVEKGDCNPNHYAELNDRIARETWRKQLFGASMGNDSPYPIEDPANVDKRRSELGLFEPIEVYAYYHGITYQRPSLESARQELKTERENAQKNYRKFKQLIDRKELDSANIYLKKAIKAYGDLSNDQLYQASVKLAQVNYLQSEEISIKIIKVLIWRKWKRRHAILNNNKFISLHKNAKWNNIKKLLQKSK